MPRNRGIHGERSLSRHENLKKQSRPKCPRVPRFWEGFNWGSPTARIFGVAKTEGERAFTMLSHDKNNLW